MDQNKKTISGHLHRRHINFSRINMAIIISIFALVGAFILIQSHAAPNPNLPGDLNNDNTVNGLDLSLLLTAWGTNNTNDDINNDGIVNGLDLSILLSHWGQTYNPSSSQIYWGAWMEGPNTYGYYYGNPAPDGQNWSTAPWGNTGNTWDRFEQNTGKKVTIDHYGQPNMWLQTSFNGNLNNIITSRGAIPLLDMDSGTTPLSDIANGVYDPQIKTWAGNVKAWGKPFFFRWDWEMNGTWFGWGSQAKTSPLTYVKSWQRVHDDVVSAGATNVTWVWCPNVEPGSGTPINSLYPGDAYVDWTCMDGYNTSSASSWQTFSQIFGQTYKDILNIAPTKPMMIGETASREVGGSKATWISDTLNTQLPKNFPKIRAFVWFNWRIAQNGTNEPWPIESSSTSQAAFKAGIDTSYYEAGNSALSSLPPLTKVPVP